MTSESLFLFDLDGTLLDSNSVWREVDRTFLARRGLPYTHAYYEGVAHSIFPIAAQFTKDFCHLSESCQEIMDEWMDLAGDAYARTVPIKPGVRAYLKQCKNEGRRMAVVTSSLRVHCEAALRRHELDKYFERVTYAQELGLVKQNAEVWRTAAREAGVEPERCTVFDDSLSACRGAREARMRVVGVYDDYYSGDQKEMEGFCDVYIRSFEELLYTK